MKEIILGCLIANLIMFILGSGIITLTGYIIYRKNKSKLDEFIGRGVESYKTFTDTINKILKLLDKFKIK